MHIIYLHVLKGRCVKNTKKKTIYRPFYTKKNKTQHLNKNIQVLWGYFKNKKLNIKSSSYYPETEQNMANREKIW